MAGASAPSIEDAVVTIASKTTAESTLDTSSVNVEASSQYNQLPSKEDARKEDYIKSPLKGTNDGVPASAASTAAGDRPQPRSDIAYVVKVLEKHLLAAKRELITIKSDDPSAEDEEAYQGKIERLPMSDWMTEKSVKPSLPTVAFRAYYREVPTSAKRTTKDSSTNPDSLLGSEQPQRIVISSPYLETELVRITNMSLSASPILMKPPYKAFVQFWPEIKNRLAKLKAALLRLETRETAKSDLDPASKSETAEEVLGDTDVDNPTERDNSDIVGKDEPWLRWRISHLEVLHDFIEAELSHHLTVRAKIEDGSLESIAFSDLWQLFKPGDILYSKEYGFEQLYKAYAITGGQILLRNRMAYEVANMRRNAEARRERKSRDRTWGTRSSGSDIDQNLSDSEDDWNAYPRGATIGIGTWTSLTIDCFSIGMDSTRLGAIDEYKRIQWYIGKKELSHLPVIPLRFVPDKDDVVKRLEARGLRCAQCYGHKKYDGFTYDARGRTKRERLQGDVFVDFEEYYRRKRASEPRLGVLRRTTPDRSEVEERRQIDTDLFSMDHEVDQQKSDVCLASVLLETQPKSREEVAQDPEQLQLMRHQVIAFVFRTRRWVRLEIDFIEDIDKSIEVRNSGFDDLVILPKHRRLLVSLVDSHSSSAHEERKNSQKESKPLNQLDLVRGKGLGLIVLLHGPPGTGKTSTAETIAAYTGRPLYSITCGDLGNNVEQVLEKHTSRADKWGCVLLLDEADVFLMRRDFVDTIRNSLVSIFLRTLEYYSGILFLTTNRVGVIDEAFKSRIHIALRYPKVKLPTTLAIWKGCLDRIEKDNEFRDIKIKFDQDELMEFAEEHYHKHHKKNATWNGRQIRNAFQTAIAMGQYERTRKINKKGFTEEEALATGKSKWRTIELTKSNLETIAETAQDFDKYMKSVHKFPDVEIAKADQLRDDDFSESSEEEEYLIQKVPIKQSSSRSKKSVSASKKSGKSVATSSKAKQKDKSSSEDNVPAEGAAKSSSEQETTDDDD
ncbi:uncharacterized protein F4807DRAFT_308284 [Annulohypoxylon truncatum]|uniref:uncharacterized protein n=1 Tax=Annulohypoxylon truncatum TaxID=327061 RepID=UPI0020077C4F|nr:uncharacterized protein F4807DRAFT_308284 [Annulohypoxylon truncatum]KAI1213011.1 hypothetical protein F4807DRAFT_308284 [Annulohypoxylon truncatum]